MKKLTADELKKLADIFNVSSDDILNQGKSIKVILEKGKSKKGEEEYPKFRYSTKLEGYLQLTADITKLYVILQDA